MFQKWLQKLGPGLITGAADDDPSGIATYSQAGAQFGFHMLWTVFFTYPLMVGIQMVSARIGCASGHGLAGNIRKHYPKWLLTFLVLTLLSANIINLAADISAMGSAVKLILGGPAQLYSAILGLLSIALEVFLPYRRYVRILKWLTLALLAYVGTVFAVHIPWSNVALGTFLPHLSLQPEYITSAVAVFGTTISPYLFFWQASQEVEEKKMARLLKTQASIQENLERIKIDTYLGMGFSNLIAYFIILTTAATLHLHGITNIETSEQAASALKPIAGELAFLFFSLGIIGTGLLAVPILAGSAAYALAEAFHWRSGLEVKPSKAKRFYTIITVSILLGVGLGFTPFNPIKALYWAAVINGVCAIPIMAIMMHMSIRKEIMGSFTVTKKLYVLGWLATISMAAAVFLMFFIH